MTENKPVDIIKKSAFFTTLFLFSFILMIIKNGADPDLWHRMAVGKIFSQTGWIAYHDIFSYFPKNEIWIDHEWLSGVVFYYIADHFGDYGFIILQVVMTFLILFLIYKINQLISPENKNRISFYLIALIGFHAGLSSTLRCQSFTYLFFALWIYALERIRRGETRLIWIFPVTMLFWANFHGGFLAGIGLIVFYIAGEFLNRRSVKKYFAILALILPVTFINPYGIKYWQYILEATTMQRPYITEWESFNLFESIYSGLGIKLLILILFLGYGYKILKKQFNIDKVELIAIAVTLYLGIKHERHSVFFAILAASFGYQHFTAFLNATVGKLEQKITGFLNQDTLEKINFSKDYAVYFFLILTSVSIISSIPIKITLEEYPVKEVDFIKRNKLSGNLFVPFNWGTYAMWKLYPQNYVSIDGRFEEVYKIEAYMDVIKFNFLNEDQEEILNKYHHDVFLLELDTKAYEMLKSRQDWQLVYKGEMGAVFLPISEKLMNPQMPYDNPCYYIKTKYKNNIDF